MLGVCTWWWRASPRWSTLALATIVVMAGSQIAYLVGGENYLRLWDVTEYKELWIPLGFAFYAAEVAARALRRPQTAAPGGSSSSEVAEVAEAAEAAERQPV